MNTTTSLHAACALLLIALAACTQTTSPAPTDIPAELRCETAADCVPDQCCHPAGAVNTANAPNCAAVLCSASCEPGTLDCGQGRIDCLNNRCAAIIDQPLTDDPQ